ncbi:VOC family protein [Nocardia seriolae]|uniref:VOC family protein n=1 Tax=Nocardia seriolae TaxID=37332 RepID=UPI00217CF68D|nr:VOC family protein [Nocardia seriolae]WKY56440.1 VOC family protein [Nocardia seriolae]
MDWRIMHSEDGYALITDGKSVLCFGFVEGHTAAPWPDSPLHPKRVHVDLNVVDIDQATDLAVALGATIPEFQPGLNPDWDNQLPWGIVLDPEGHPHLPESQGVAELLRLRWWHAGCRASR